MKFSLAFLAVLALSGVSNINAGPVRASSELHAVLEEFLALVPKEKVFEIAADYLEHDPEVQRVVTYIMSNDFKELVEKVESIEDVINFYNYLDEAGLDIYGMVNKLHDLLELPPLIPNKPRMLARRTGGLSGLIHDVKAVLPIDKIKALYHEKLETSKAFADLIRHLSSPKCQELVNKLRNNAEFKKIVAFCQEAGVDINAIKSLLATIFGLEFPTYRRSMQRNLHDDFNDFYKLLPVEQIHQIAVDYLEEDPEINQVIEYLATPEFADVVQALENMKEVRDFFAYLQESNLDVYALLNRIHGFLGIPDFKPFSLTGRRTGGLSGLIADIKAVLPLDKIKALYKEKLETSPDFAYLVKRLSSPECQNFIDKVLANEKAKEIIQKLKNHGVDVKAIADLLTKILGLHFPTSRSVTRESRNLVEELGDFIDLLPLEEMVDVALTYVFNDDDVRTAGAYIKSAEFKNLATKAQQNNEFRIFVGYLETSGLPIVKYLNNLNRDLGLPEVVPVQNFMRSSAENGVRKMMNDIEALLPVEKIKALYHEKLQNSKVFANFVARLQAPEFQEIVSNLAYNEDFQKLGYRAAEFGIDLEVMVKFMSKVFGIVIPDELLPGHNSEGYY